MCKKTSENNSSLSSDAGNMLKILLTLLISFIISVPFFSTPVGEEMFLNYQETKLHKTIYCKYVDWFGAEGFNKLKFILKCKM
ncbi:MAG: ethanolamine ammonia-lyase large subunit [Thermoproteota archaeon]